MSIHSRAWFKPVAYYFVSLAVLLAIYHASLSQPPRADEHLVIYMFQLYVGAIDTLIHSYSFSRSFMHADLHEFRPIKNSLMAVEWIAFGYKFWAYQLLGIMLHAVVVTQLFFTLRNVMKTTIVFAIGLTFWFACFPMVGEAVTWQNVHGPILYSIFLLSGLRIWWVAESKQRFNLWCFLCFFLAALTEDEGTAAAVLGFYCCVFGLLAYRRNQSKAAQYFYFTNAAAFFSTVFAVVVLSYLDLRLYGFTLKDLLQAMNSQTNLLQLATYPFRVAWFWLDAFFVPSAYQFYAAGRMEIGPAESFGFWYWLNICLVIILLFNAARSVILQLKKPENDALRIVILLVMLAFGYAALFTAGRVAERGLDFAIHNALYVAYPFSVFVVLILGFLLRFEPIAHFRSLTFGSTMISIAYIGLMQSYSMVSVDDRMRVHYANDNALYASVLSSVAESPDPYTFTFSFKEPCPTNRVLPWLWNKTIAEATFPRWYRAKGGEVTLKCPMAKPESRSQ